MTISCSLTLKAAPFDRSKVTKLFKSACLAAGARPINFRGQRHTFATRLAASGQPLRATQEFPGHADSKTTQIYARYTSSEHEVEMVNEAFAQPASVNASDRLPEVATADVQEA